VILDRFIDIAKFQLESP